MFATNHSLILSENDDAFWNRLVYIAFTKAVPKDLQDPHLLDKLLNEKDAFVSTVMQELPGLIINNFSLVGEEETKEAITLYQKFANRSISDIVCEYLDNTVIVSDEKTFVSTAEINVEFEKQTGNKVDSAEFGKILRKYLDQFPGIVEKRQTIDGHKIRGYTGIKFVRHDNLSSL